MMEAQSVSRVTNNLFCQVEKRSEVGAEKWNTFVEAHAEGWWWHRWEWLDYCLAYRGGNDQSIAVVCGDDKRIVAILPLIIERGKYMAGGNPTPFPLWSESDLGSTAMKIIADYLTVEANIHGVAEGLFMKTPLREHANPLPEWQDCIEDASFQSRVVDLSRMEENRWAGMRKSYHSLIHRGNASHHIHEVIGVSGVNTYEMLHRQVFNDPRSHKTYDMQTAWGDKSIARTWIAYERLADMKKPIAAVLWYCDKGRAYYASSACTVNNIAHALLWESMNGLAAHGIQYAELGWHGMHGETEKEKSIAFFKKGFGGEDWPVPCMRWIFRTDANLEGQA